MQLLDVGRNVIPMAMLEVDVMHMPWVDHRSAHFISLPYSSTDVTRYCQKRHTSSKKPNWNSYHSFGPAEHTSDHVRASPCKGIHVGHYCKRVLSNTNGGGEGLHSSETAR